MGDLSRGLWQHEPPQPFTPPEPPAPSEQLAASMRYLQQRYGEALADATGLAEALAAEFGALLGDLALGFGYRPGPRAEQGDPTGDPPLARDA